MAVLSTEHPTTLRPAPGARWRTWVANDAPAALPHFTAHERGGVAGGPSHEIQLADDPASFGKWIAPAFPMRGGATYRCRLWQRTDGVAHPQLNAPAMLTWRGDRAPAWSRPWNPANVDRGRDASADATLLVERQYLKPTAVTDGDWRLLELIVRAPDEATEAEIEGWLRHAPGARTWYSGAALEEVPPQPKRVVTLGTVRAVPHSGTTLDENRQLLAQLVEAAADQGAQVVCLPENGVSHGTGLPHREFAEPLHGPTVDVLGRVAAARGVYVVAQFHEREAHRIHNTAVLLDPRGNIAAQFRKMHLTTGEWENGIVPGDGPVVADTEIGRLGMLVCFDLHFPEAVRQTVLAGAEVIFGPTVGDRSPERRDAVTRAHAVANGVYVVTSLVFHPSDIVDTEGRLIARAEAPNSVAVAAVDLDYKATVEGRSRGADNGTAPGSYWPARRTDLYGDW
jgi:predicted amidohydrolase